MADEPQDQKSTLEIEQLKLTNRRIEAEIAKFERENVPERWWPKLLRNIVAFGGVITVAATAYGLLDSYNKTISDREKTRQFDQQTKFEQALKRLESASTMSKLVGVSLLANYLNESDQRFHRQILFAFGSLIATERDVQTQAAVRDVIETSSRTSVKDDDWDYFASILVSMNRALVIKTDLFNRRGDQDDKALNDDEKSVRFLSQALAALGRRGALQNYGDYDGIYCGDCDFRSASFQNGSHFSRAILDRGNFQNATLRNAKFKNARLNGTIFVEADLDGAVFENSGFRMLPDGATVETPEDNPIDQSAKIAVEVLELDDVSSLSFPRFDCASLKEARFIKVPFFTAISYYAGSKPRPELKLGADLSKSKHTGLDMTASNFHKAILTQAHFDNVRFLDVTESHSRLSNLPMFANGIDVGNSSVWVGTVGESFMEKINDGYVGFKSSVRGALYQAQMDGTHFPETISAILAEKLPSREDQQPLNMFGFSFGPVDRYSECKPRNVVVPPLDQANK